MTDAHELEPIKRKDGTEGLPARGYSWEPFLPDHVQNMLHGARSPRVIEAMAKVVKSEVTADAPWLLKPIFGDALERYCRAEGRARLLADHIFRVCDEEGARRVPIRLWESAVACDNAASRAANDLGLTPLSRARLASLTATTEATSEGLAQLAERGRAIRQRREASLQLVKDDDNEADDVPQELILRPLERRRRLRNLYLVRRCQLSFPLIPGSLSVWTRTATAAWFRSWRGNASTASYCRCLGASVPTGSCAR